MTEHMFHTLLLLLSAGDSYTLLAAQSAISLLHILSVTLSTRL
jgi:hypothetical protein